MKNLNISTSALSKICGVSQGTVDRALNNRPGIKLSTKQKILTAAKKFGYRAPIQANTGKVIGQIGIVVFDLNNEFFSELIMELEYAFRSEGYGTSVMFSHYDADYEIECIINLYNMGVKGIVLCSVNSGAEFTNFLNMLGIPIAAVGNRISGVPYIGLDDFASMHRLTETVLKNRWDNIFYFSPAIEYPNAFAQRLRYEGFLKAAGNTEYTVLTNIEDVRSAYEGKTVFICSTDYYAIQIYRKNRNVKIFGFDNISALDKYKLPISSVGYSAAQIAQCAADIIKNRRKDVFTVDYFIVER